MRRIRSVPFLVVLAIVSAMVTGTRPEKLRAQGAESLGIGRVYEVITIENPNPVAGSRFGQGLYSPGDLNGDGSKDLIVPNNTSTNAGQVIAIDGSTGATLYTVDPPDPSLGGNAETFSQFVGGMPDIGSCPNPGAEPSKPCPDDTIGRKDGTPDLLLSSPGWDFSPEVLDIGRAYVVDGTTGAVLKAIDMPADDRVEQAAGGIKPGFGRAVISPYSDYPSDAAPVKLGDVDLGGEPDIVVGASTYRDAGPADNPACDPGPCSGSGRTYVFRGEDIVNTGPDEPISTPYKVIRNPLAQTDDPSTPLTNVELFGHLIIPVGDVGACTVDPGPGNSCPFRSSTLTQDARPEFMVSAYRTDYPAGFADTGVGYLVEGNTGAILFRYNHPEPQQGVLFSWLLYNQQAVGDVGDTSLPDILLPSFRQNVTTNGQGRLYAFSGNFRTHPVSMLFSVMNDPTPANGGNFGAPVAGIGDVAGDTRNEVLVGSVGPFIPGSDRTIMNDIHIFAPHTGTLLRSFSDPAAQPGSAFGSGVAGLRDVNGDGMLDFAVGSGNWNHPDRTAQGRVYIFKSTDTVGRTISLRLKKHLIAVGRVGAPPAPELCASEVKVIIQRNGKRTARTITSSTGRFRVSLPDRQGPYRAKALQLEIDGLTCATGKSGVVRHIHPKSPARSGR